MESKIKVIKQLAEPRETKVTQMIKKQIGALGARLKKCVRKVSRTKWKPYTDRTFAETEMHIVLVFLSHPLCCLAHLAEQQQPLMCAVSHVFFYYACTHAHTHTHMQKHISALCAETSLE